MDGGNTGDDIARGLGEGGKPAMPGGTAAPLSRLAWALCLSRKVAVAVAGGLVLIVGLAMIVLPGPAIVVIPLGLALLATEFPWAARLLLHLRAWAARTVARVRRSGPQVIGSTPQR